MKTKSLVRDSRRSPLDNTTIYTARMVGRVCPQRAGARPCLAKRMECVELAPAVGCVARFESGSKLHALHTLRPIWFRLCRAEDPARRDALPDTRTRMVVLLKCMLLTTLAVALLACGQISTVAQTVT